MFPTIGISISGIALTPFFSTLTAAEKIALTCISIISGYTTANRHPLNPSIGLNSCRASIVSTIDFGVVLSSFAISSISFTCSALGKNSCNGGSSILIITGSPFIAVKIPSKSSLW